MTWYQPLEMSMVSDMADFQDHHIDPSSLMSFQPSDADWIGKDAMDLLPWDIPFDEPSFDLPNDFVEPLAYATSTSGSPEAFNGYTSSGQAPEDALSCSSLASDAESDAWSPSLSKSERPSPTRSIGIKRPREETTDKDLARSNVSDRPVKKSPSSDAPSTVKEDSSEKAVSSPASSSKEEDAASRKASESTTTTSSKSTTSSKPQTDTEMTAVMKRKKAAHNAIEKRYRTNMNAKFLALGNAIPKSAAQAANKGGTRKSSSSLNRDGQQNKSEILTNALAYIRELQEENRLLQNELTVLKENLLPGSVVWRGV
ncbi:hypothetical protein VTN77DRAFT_2881 [Rasamsonia byssochlamydoides]|uniref:uncharacterized protein n=1 Tax=Rasamsonia byssochlamydoides TaxID=89139 RepID=UPI003743F973